MATACSDGVLRLWDTSASQLQQCSVPLYGGMSAACAWDPDGLCIASVATSGDVVVVVGLLTLASLHAIKPAPLLAVSLT